jgi:hypothetical protein
MEVLDDEQDRFARSGVREAVEDQRVHAGGRSAGQRRCGGSGRRAEEVLRAVVEPALPVDDGQQRDRRLLEPRALPGQDAIAVGAGARHQLRKQAALAHARLAADEHEGRRTIACPRQGGGELAQLVRTPDEDRTR